MAENEILDVGNPNHYKRWRKVLGDTNASLAEVAEVAGALSDDFAEVFMQKLRDETL